MYFSTMDAQRSGKVASFPTVTAVVDKREEVGHVILSLFTIFNEKETTSME